MHTAVKVGCLALVLLVVTGCHAKRPVNTEPAEDATPKQPEPGDDAPAAPRESSEPLEATTANGVVGRLGGHAFRFGERHQFLGFRPDGMRYYTSPWFNGGICEWDAQTGKLLTTKQLPAETNVHAISPDAQLFVTSGDDKGLQVRRVADGSVLRDSPEYDREFRPHHVAIGPKNDVMAVGDEYGGMRIYDLTTGKRRASPLTDGKYDDTPLSWVWIEHLYFLDDGQKLVVCKPKKTPLVWDLKEEKILRDFGPATYESALAWPMPNGALLTLASDRMVTFTGGGQTPEGGHHSWSVGVRHGTVRIADLLTGKEIRSFELPQEVRAAALSGDGKLLATQGANYDDEERKLVVWDVETGKRLADTPGAERSWDVAFAPDNQTLVTIGNRSLRFWRLPSERGASPGRLVELHPGGESAERVTALRFTPDGRQLLVVGAAGVAVWTVPEQKCVQTFGKHDDYAGNVFALDPKGKYAILAQHSTAERWDFDGMGWVKLNQGDRSYLDIEWVALRLAISPDGNRVVGASRKTEMFTVGGKFPATFQGWTSTEGKSSPVDEDTAQAVLHEDCVALAFSPNAKLLAVAHGPRHYVATKVAILDANAKFRKLRGFAFPRGTIHDVAYSPDGTYLAVGGGKKDEFHNQDKFGTPADHGVLLYPSQGERPLTAFEGHVGPVLSLAFSPDGKWLATGSADKACRLWNVDKGVQVRVLGGHEGPVNAVAFSPDGKLLATGSEDTTVLLWDVDKLLVKP